MAGERTEQATQHRRERSAQGWRRTAQPRAVGRGRNSGRSHGVGRHGPSSADRLARDLCRISRSGLPCPLGTVPDPAHALRPAPVDVQHFWAAGRNDGGSSRSLFRSGRSADRRNQLLCRGSGLQVGPHQPGLQHQKSLFSALRRANGQIAHPRQLSGRLRRATYRPAVDHSSVFDCAAGSARHGCLWTAPGHGMAALCLVGRRLPGGVAEPRVAAEDEPAGYARRVQTDRGQSADSRPYTQLAAPDAPPQGEGRRLQGRRGAGQSDPLRRGLGLRFCHHGSAQSAWPKAAICWPKRSRPRPAGRECRSSRTHRWPARSTARSRWASRFRSIFMLPWRPFLPISTVSAWSAEMRERRAREAATKAAARSTATQSGRPGSGIPPFAGGPQ